MALEIEDDVAGFLGVDIKKNTATGEITLKQVGLKKKIFLLWQFQLTVHWEKMKLGNHRTAISTAHLWSECASTCTAIPVPRLALP